MKIFIILRNSYKQNVIKLITDWDLIDIPKAKKKERNWGRIKGKRKRDRERVKGGGREEKEWGEKEERERQKERKTGEKRERRKEEICKAARNWQHHLGKVSSVT